MEAVFDAEEDWAFGLLRFDSLLLLEMFRSEEISKSDN
jgi:hypothetical protein